jgi:hypothetical protein
MSGGCHLSGGKITQEIELPEGWSQPSPLFWRNSLTFVQSPVVVCQPDWRSAGRHLEKEIKL